MSATATQQLAKRTMTTQTRVPIVRPFAGAEHTLVLRLSHGKTVVVTRRWWSDFLKTLS